MTPTLYGALLHALRHYTDAYEQGWTYEQLRDMGMGIGLCNYFRYIQHHDGSDTLNQELAPELILYIRQLPADQKFGPYFIAEHPNFTNNMGRPEQIPEKCIAPRIRFLTFILDKYRDSVPNGEALYPQKTS